MQIMSVNRTPRPSFTRTEAHDCSNSHNTCGQFNYYTRCISCSSFVSTIVIKQKTKGLDDNAVQMKCKTIRSEPTSQYRTVLQTQRLTSCQHNYVNKYKVLQFTT